MQTETLRQLSQHVVRFHIDLVNAESHFISTESMQSFCKILDQLGLTDIFKILTFRTGSVNIESDSTVT
jgi:hypothetical protein